MFEGKRGRGEKELKELIGEEIIINCQLSIVNYQLSIVNCFGLYDKGVGVKKIFPPQGSRREQTYLSSSLRLLYKVMFLHQTCLRSRLTSCSCCNFWYAPQTGHRYRRVSRCSSLRLLLSYVSAL